MCKANAIIWPAEKYLCSSLCFLAVFFSCVSTVFLGFIGACIEGSQMHAFALAVCLIMLPVSWVNECQGAPWAICVVPLRPVGMTKQPPGELEWAGAWWKQDGGSDPSVCTLHVCVTARERDGMLENRQRSWREGRANERGRGIKRKDR